MRSEAAISEKSIPEDITASQLMEALSSGIKKENKNSDQLNSVRSRGSRIVESVPFSRLSPLCETCQSKRRPQKM